jgi:hypothetical protein
MSVCLAGIPQIDRLAFHAHRRLPAAVAWDDRAIRDQVWQSVVFGPRECLVQIRGLGGEYLDDLVDVAVGGRSGDAVIPPESGRVGAVAEPSQRQGGLPEAGQRPAALGGGSPAAFGSQQPGDMAYEFPGDIERGTIGDHVELSVEGRSCGETSSIGSSTPVSGHSDPSACLSRWCRLCPLMHYCPNRFH